MAKLREDQTVELENGQVLFGDDPVFVGQLPELVELFAPDKEAAAPVQGPAVISGGGGRQGPRGLRGPEGPPGPQGPPGPGGGGGWVDDGAVVRLETSTDQVAIGAAAPFGSEKLLVVGDVRIDGAVQLLGGGSFFIESEDGSGVPVSGASTGRIRYNDTTGTFQVSTQGGAYEDLATTGGVSPWTTTGTTLHPVTLTNSVTVGSSSEIGKLGVVGDADEVQLRVRAFAGQASNLVLWESAAPSTLFAFTLAGDMRVGTAGAVSGEQWTFRRDQNALTSFRVHNGTNGASAAARTLTSASGAGDAVVGVTAPLFAPAGGYVADDVQFYGQGGIASVSIGTPDTAAPIRFVFGGTEEARFTTAGALLVGTTTFTGRLTVVSGGVGETTIAGRASGAQTADLLQLRDQFGASIFRVTGPAQTTQAFVQVAPTDQSGGDGPAAIAVTAANQTGVNAAVAHRDTVFDFDRTLEWSTGAATTYTGIFVDAGTLTATAATQTITEAATVRIESAPAAGANVSITNAYALFVDAGNVRIDDVLLVGATAPSGAELLRVAGDARVEGKLTVTGALDPTSVLLSGGTALFIESNDGSTAPVSGASTGRLRYNDSTGTWQISTQGGAYSDIGTGSITGGGAATQVAFFDAPSNIVGDAGLTYDSTNDALTVGLARIHTTGTDNTFVGASAGNFTLSAADSVGVGSGALSSSTSGSDNTAVGHDALRDNTTGAGNTAFGRHALLSCTGGVFNNAFGRLALDAVTTGDNNCAFGHNTLSAADVTDCSAFGHNALSSVSFSGDHSAFGARALTANTSGTRNNAFGHEALTSNTTRSDCCAFGNRALASVTTGVVDDECSAFGNETLELLTSGPRHCAFGLRALTTMTTGSDGSAFGYRALEDSVGSRNSAFGSRALQQHSTGGGNCAFGNNTLAGGTAMSDTCAFGEDALNANTASESHAFGTRALTANGGGTQSSAFGFEALVANTSASFNSAFGHSALASTTTSGSSCAFGHDALNANTAIGVNGFGDSALVANTSGVNNGFGQNVLFSNTTGTRNDAFGRAALFSNVTGDDNAAFGDNALNANTASANSAFGSASLEANTSGTRNSAFGNDALGSVTTGVDCSAFGYQALDVATASGNTAMGSGALGATTSGADNTALGFGAGATITTGADNLFLGQNADSSVATATNASAIGANASVDGSNLMVFGDANVTVIRPGSDGGAALGSSSFTFQNLFLDANRETLAADKTIVSTDPAWHSLDPGGANRNVDLPAEAKGLHFMIGNRNGGANTLTVREDSGVTTLVTLAQDEAALFVSDGTGWTVLYGNAANIT